MAHGILDKQLPNSKLGLQGGTPNKRAGASAINDIHYDAKAKAHVGGHTALEPGGQPTKYYDNLPE